MRNVAGSALGGFVASWCSLALLLSAAALADPAAAGAEPLRARCSIVEPSTLSCDFRLADPADVLGVQVSAGGVPLTQATWDPYPTPRSLTAVLLLVDSSGSGRQLYAAQAAEDLTAVLEAAPGHVRFGLASFDSELSLAAPIGESRTVIRDAAKQLKATDRPTELYRDAIDAIRALAATPADRRGLLLLSDGVAEDRAYFHQDVVNAAETHGVTIVAFGYPRSPAQTVALQTLRRLSEDTGGTFLTADANGRVAREAIPGVFRALDGGGSLRADLSPALAAGVSGSSKVRVIVQTSRGTVEGQPLVELPARPTGTTAPGSGVGTAGAVQAQPPPTAGAPPVRVGPPDPTPSRTVQQGHGSALSPGLFLGGGATAVALLVWLWWRRAPRRSAQRTGGETPAGYLHFRDQPEREGFAVVGSTVRIGRQRDNDLVLEDTSVSRHHAEIHRGADGSLTLVDLDSLNGVFVNERQIKSAGLSDGDSVEIGDVRLAFTHQASAPRDSRRSAGGGLEKTVIARPDDLLTDRGPG